MNRKGFTLLELMVVLAVVAILVSVALPSYQSIMIRIHRSEAVIELMNIAACQETVFATKGSFDTGQCQREPLDYYRFRIDPPDSTASLNFTAWAVPQGKQARDLCGNLALDQTGFRQASGNNVDVDRCWELR